MKMTGNTILILGIVTSDVSDPKAIATLYERVVADLPGLNLLINCAGIMRKIDLQKVRANLEDVTPEIETNLNGTIWMDMQFLPHLKRQPNAAIVNVSSGLAFVPMPISPIYSASKAAIHAFTLSLRVQLKNTKIESLRTRAPRDRHSAVQGRFHPRGYRRCKSDERTDARETCHRWNGKRRFGNSPRPGHRVEDGKQDRRTLC